MKTILIHGFGHRAASWDETVSHMKSSQDILCPDLPSLLRGQEAAYQNLYAAFAEDCDRLGGPLHLCGLSLGGILALHYASEHPEQVSSLVLIGTPHRIPKAAFALQTVIFRLLPTSAFQTMAFPKQDTLALSSSMKDLELGGLSQHIQCPTLILCGEKDRTNLKSAHFFSQNITNAALTVVEGAGHALNEDAPQALARLLDDFYGRIPG